MDTTFWYIAGFFFILGAAFIAVLWLLFTIISRVSARRKAAKEADPNQFEVARLIRDNVTQELVVGMDGREFKTVAELNPAQQRRLSFSSNVLAKWLGQPVSATDPASAESPVPTEQPASAEQSAGLSTPSTSTEFPASPNDWVPAEALAADLAGPVVQPFISEPTSQVKPVSTQLPDVVGGILKPTQVQAPVFKSIATQINDILQTRLAGTPFEARGITVNDAPDHGVLVTVDGEKYPGVKDVPDEEVRNLIRSAVMEWEKQTKPSSK